MLLALTLALAACGDGDADGPAGDPVGEQQPDRVTFALNWLPTDEAVGWYVALDQGWFAEEGIEVEIARGFGSGDTAKRVATGEAEFGVADLSGIVPLRLNEDVPVLGVAATYARPPHGVFFRAGEGIEEPRDLEGRDIVCSSNNSVLLMFPAFAAATGIDEDTINWQLSDPAGLNSVFAGGQGDALCHFAKEIVILQALSDEEFGYFAFADYGVSGHAHMIITHEDVVEERPDLVRRFLRAALRGLEYAVENPVEAIDILLEYTAEENDPDETHAQWQINREYMVNEDVERHGYGYISSERMAETFDTLVGALDDVDPGERTVDDLYTTEFLP